MILEELGRVDGELPAQHSHDAVAERTEQEELWVDTVQVNWLLHGRGALGLWLQRADFRKQLIVRSLGRVGFRWFRRGRCLVRTKCCDRPIIGGSCKPWLEIVLHLRRLDRGHDSQRHRCP